MGLVMENLTSRHIQKDEADRLGIKHGWYGIKVQGTLMTGPSGSQSECLKHIEKLMGHAANTRSFGDAKQTKSDKS
jgi:hypothetical protein